MKQHLAHLKTNELSEAVEALWDSPEDLYLIQRELLRRKTMGAARLRMTVEARIAAFGGGELRTETSEGSHEETTSDVAALKKQISSLRIEVMKLRTMAGLSGAKAYLYARIGAHESITDDGLKALREAHRSSLLNGGKARGMGDDDVSDVVSGALSAFLEDAFDEIARLRSEHR